MSSQRLVQRPRGSNGSLPHAHDHDPRADPRISDQMRNEIPTKITCVLRFAAAAGACQIDCANSAPQRSEAKAREWRVASATRWPVARARLVRTAFDRKGKSCPRRYTCNDGRPRTVRAENSNPRPSSRPGPSPATPSPHQAQGGNETKLHRTSKSRIASYFHAMVDLGTKLSSPVVVCFVPTRVNRTTTLRQWISFTPPRCAVCGVRCAMCECIRRTYARPHPPPQIGRCSVSTHRVIPTTPCSSSFPPRSPAVFTRSPLRK